MNRQRTYNKSKQFTPPFLKFKTFITAIANPIKQEWPFIFLSTLFIGSSGYWIVKPFTSEVPYMQSWLLRFGTGSVMAYLMACILVMLSRGKWRTSVRGLLLAALSAIFLVEGFAFGKWGMHISPTLLTLAAETNTKEIATVTQMLFCTKVFRQIAIAYIVLMTLFGVMQHYRRHINRMIGNHAKAGVTVTIAVVVAGITGISGAVANMQLLSGMLNARTHLELQFFVGTHHQYPEWNDNMTRLLFSCRSSSLVARDISGWENIQNNFLDNGIATSDTSDSLQVVCIIGESFIRSHSSLYGYPLQTNPRLEQLAEQGNLVAFSDMMSPHHNTSASVRTIMSLNHDGTGDAWNTTVSLPAVFKKAGYNVYVLDNQQTGNSSIYSFALGRMLFNPVMTQKCYDIADYKSHWQPDLTFVSETERLHMPLNQKALTIYHLSAQHLWPYAPESPEWKRFNIDDIPVGNRPWLDNEMKQRIADYDNATFYNDSVVAGIIKRYSNSNAVVVYFPDHGEEIYDYRPEAHRPQPLQGLEREYLDHVNAIPMFVWMSDIYMKKHPVTAKTIREASARPGTTAEVSHMLVGLGQISTPSYDPTRDILSTDYTPRPRFTSRGLLFDRRAKGTD